MTFESQMHWTSKLRKTRQDEDGARRREKTDKKLLCAKNILHDFNESLT